MLSISKYLLNKKFSQFARIRFQRKSQDIKNFIYFVNEKDFEGDKDELITSLKSKEPVRFKDIIKNKYGIIYPNSQTSTYERICLVAVPKNSDKIRKVTSQAFKSLSSYQIDKVHIGFSQYLPLHYRRIISSSLIMTNYSFKVLGNLKSTTDDSSNREKKVNHKNKSKVVKEIIFDLSNDPTNHNNLNSIKLWVNLANSTLYTRSLANTRPNIADCDFLEEAAKTIIENNKENRILNLEVIKGNELLVKGLNLIHAVGKSAETEPRIIILTYNGLKETNKYSHAIVGKGLTFDTGGLNLKPTNYIEDMYLDKHGACNVLSIFKTVVEMKLPINLVCALGVAENSIDSLSYKPSDIIKSYKGYTVEITNTDAEGRLVLADTLSYVQDNYKPDNIIDLATLTGACMVALGNKTAGLFSNNGDLALNIVKAADEVLEYVWHLPINDEHRDDIKSTFADLKNAGKDRYGGASKGAAFLEKFINKGVNWVHLDIAGPSHAVSDYDCWTAGATGFGTQLILKYLYNYIYNTDVHQNDFHEPYSFTTQNILNNEKLSNISDEKISGTSEDLISDKTQFPDSAFPLDTSKINP